jgi:hypothetical protein
MASMDLDAFDGALKEYYTGTKVKRLQYEDHPFLAMVPKNTNFVGDVLPQPVIFGGPQGRSATFATAKANKRAGKVTKFLLERAKDYGLISIDNETLEASAGNEGAFISAKTHEIDGMFNNVSTSLSAALFRDGNGWIGQVYAEPSENASTFVITLAQAEDVVNFEVGQVITIYSAVSSGTKRNSDGTDDEWVIAAINRDSGAITLTGTYDSSGTITANDYIFTEGDEGLKVKGLEAWIPATAPTSSAFLGVDRSVDPVRLGGIRYDASAMSIEEGLISAAARAHREGAKLTHCFMNHANWANLEKEQGSKVQIIKEQVAGLGFTGIQLATPKGVIKVFADGSCLATRAYMLQMDTWKLHSLGEAPKFIGGDGMKFLRESDSDGVEARVGYYAQLGCNAPGFNVNVKLS